MAKRAPEGEGTYNPLSESLIQSVLNGPSAAKTAVETPGPPPPAIGERSRAPAAPRPVTGQLATFPLAAEHEERSVERLSREKRVLLTPSEERELETLVGKIGEKLRTSLKLSHVLRAAVTVLIHAEAELKKRAEGYGELTRPPNGDALALAQFEHELAKVIASALREAPPLR
jgi:hypothetical protein